MTSDRFITNRNLDGDIVITVNDGGVSTEVMRIDGATGRVGIGTTSPVSSLDVRGDAYVSGAVTVAGVSNQLVLGTTRTVTLSAPTPASSSRTHTIPDVGANASFVMSEGAQTIAGVKTFTSAPKLDSLDENTASNGVQIRGRASGSAISAGFVGQVLSADQGAAAFSSTTMNSWVDVPLLSLSLTAGVWLITASGSAYQSSLTNSGASAMLLDMRLLNGATEVAANYSCSTFLIGGVLGVVRDIRQQDGAFSMTAIINNNSTQTVKVQAYVATSGTVATPSFGIRQYSRLYAVRIA